MRIFVDSSAYIAVADANDQDHKTATAFLKGCPPETQFHTSGYIVAETVTRLRRTASHATALRWATALLGSSQTTRYYPDELIEREALRVFERYHDYQLSFVDCTTVVFLKQLHINQIFTFDQDFQRIGYAIVPGL